LDEIELRELIGEISRGQISEDQAVDRMKMLPYESLNGYANLDHHRALRTGAPEVIYAQGKTPEQVVEIFQHLMQYNRQVMATRVSPEMYQQIGTQLPEAVYNSSARILYHAQPSEPNKTSGVLVLTAGTSDIPIAEEAALTVEIMGYQVDRMYDVGVSGLHRLLDRLPQIRKAKVIIVAAGMEGALPSVVGGLVAVPVIAVPTSIGYGASFHGVSALLGMLNSCAGGVAVMNIDNGFGAGCLALKIIRLME
jgi:NCAIR mutase (PurE)-related protein